MSSPMLNKTYEFHIDACAQAGGHAMRVINAYKIARDAVNGPQVNLVFTAQSLREQVGFGSVDHVVRYRKLAGDLPTVVSSFKSRKGGATDQWIVDSQKWVLPEITTPFCEDYARQLPFSKTPPLLTFLERHRKDKALSRQDFSRFSDLMAPLVMRWKGKPIRAFTRTEKEAMYENLRDDYLNWRRMAACRDAEGVEEIRQALERQQGMPSLENDFAFDALMATKYLWKCLFDPTRRELEEVRANAADYSWLYYLTNVLPQKADVDRRELVLVTQDDGITKLFAEMAVQQFLLPPSGSVLANPKNHLQFFNPKTKQNESLKVAETRLATYLERRGTYPKHTVANLRTFAAYMDGLVEELQQSPNAQTTSGREAITALQSAIETLRQAYPNRPIEPEEAVKTFRDRFAVSPRMYASYLELLAHQRVRKAHAYYCPEGSYCVGLS